MSFDLHFCVPKGARRPSTDEVQGYFDARALYDVGNREATYRNEDTRTLFQFAWDDEAAEEPTRALAESRAKTALEPIGVRFSINLGRPRVYALEAEPELAAFTSRFSLGVFDPQRRAAGEHERDAFLRSFTASNRRAYRAHAQSAPPDAPPLATLPAAVRERHWRWNVGREALQGRLGQDVGVPIIAYVRHEERISSAVFWSDAQNIALPEVDLILLARQAIAPRRFFLVRHSSAALIHGADLGELRALGRAEAGEAGPYWLLRAPKPPRPLVRFFNAQPPFKQIPEGLPAEDVHEAEEVEAALAEK